jgi:hypothetical protein
MPQACLPCLRQAGDSAGIPLGRVISCAAGIPVGQVAEYKSFKMLIIEVKKMLSGYRFHNTSQGLTLSQTLTSMSLKKVAEKKSFFLLNGYLTKAL